MTLDNANYHFQCNKIKRMRRIAKFMMKSLFLLPDCYSLEGFIPNTLMSVHTRSIEMTLSVVVFFFEAKSLDVCK